MMKNHGFAILSAIAGVALTAGCAVRGGVYATPPPPVTITAGIEAPPPPNGSVSVSVGQPVLATGVTVVQSSCTQGGPDPCNGLDDNCNGQIDEGCGYQSGAIQITAAWNTGADIDMYVMDPSGSEISYQNTQSSTGGFLDHDARGQCRSDQANNRIENVFWNSPQPPRGNYRVALNYWGDCGTGNPPTQATLSIAVGGRVVGAYNVMLTPGQRIDVATFNIP